MLKQVILGASIVAIANAAAGQPPLNPVPHQPEAQGHQPATGGVSLNTKDCHTLTRDIVNAQKGSECANLTALCLKAFDATGINQDCIMHLSEATLRDLEPKTALELMNGPVMNLPAKSSVLRAIIGKVEQPPNEFIMAFSKNMALMSQLFDTFSPEWPKIAQFFTEKTFPKVNVEICAKFDNAGLVSVIAPSAFKGIKGYCLSRFSDSAMQGFDKDRFKMIRPEALEWLKRSQADKIPPASVQEMSKEQAEHWGPFPYLPTLKEGANQEDRASNKEARAAKVDTHPCMTAIAWRKTVAQPARGALKKRCKELWREEQSTASGRNSPSKVAAIIAVLVVFTLLN